MLKKLRLDNYRGFESHEVELAPLSILVGQNNAGKSSVVEALRFVSIVVSRYPRLQFREPHSDSHAPLRLTGVSPSTENLQIQRDTLFYRYADPPARITAEFSSGVRIEIYIGHRGRMHAAFFNASNRLVGTRVAALKLDIGSIGILPQIGPLQISESRLNEQYVKGAIDSPLSSLHFRNQLDLYPEKFREFQAAVEATWPGLKVEHLEYGGHYDPTFRLTVRDFDFVAEIGAMGHGMQMWLQTIWFLTRVADATTVILDEPDVYMHADLQRRLLRFVKKRFAQTVIATHSTEIISDVEANNIVVVDKRRAVSRFATSIPAVQTALLQMGSVHNIGLARLASARRLLIVEGDDIQILKRYQSLIFPDTTIPLETIPMVSIGGWGGWNYAIGSKLLLTNAAGQAVSVYCVLDRDYHLDDEIQQRLSKANELGMNLHIWHKKELENYLLDPIIVERAIKRHVAKRTEPPSLDEINRQLARIEQSLKSDAFDQLAQEALRHNRAKGLSGANRTAREVLTSRIEADGLLSVVSGKRALSVLSEWSQQEFGVSLSVGKLISETQEVEVPDEIRQVLNSIETCAPFNAPPEQRD